MTSRILMTGAAGNVGRHLRASLTSPRWHWRYLDVVGSDREEDDWITGSFLDPDVVERAVAGVDAIVHLGGLSTGGYRWEEYAEVNITGTQRLFEAARRHGVPRVVYASSHHVMGRSPLERAPFDEYEFPQPDSFYAVSKVAGEALGRLYHDRHGLDVICLRIGSFRDRPRDFRTLWNWLSPDDCTRLFEASLLTPHPGFRVVWGVSRNATRVMSLAEGEAIGYVPLDDAERFRDEVSAAPYDLDPDQSRLMGGAYVAPHFDDLPEG